MYLSYVLNDELTSLQVLLCEQTKPFCTSTPLQLHDQIS